jgi:hypothetical protein
MSGVSHALLPGLPSLCHATFRAGGGENMPLARRCSLNLRDVSAIATYWLSSKSYALMRRNFRRHGMQFAL